MKLLLTTFIVTAIGALAIPSPQTTILPCPKICHLEKPVCPAGQAPTGGEGCWGCCQPISVTGPTVTERASENTDVFCTEQCLTEKPVCPSGEAPSGNPGCWGCCRPVSPTITPKPTPSVCIAECQPTKPVCPEGEAATGNENCWGCCQPIGSF